MPIISVEIMKIIDENRIKSNLELALSIILKERELYESLLRWSVDI